MGCAPPASSANARILRATFIRDINDANRPDPVAWRPVHSLRLAVASIAHPLLRDNHTLPIGRLEASRQAAIEKAVYQQSQSHGSAAYSRVVRYLALYAGRAGSRRRCEKTSVHPFFAALLGLGVVFGIPNQ